MNRPAVIVGFGQGGRMHVACLAKIRRRQAPHPAEGVTYVIDPALAPGTPGMPADVVVVAALVDIPIAIRDLAVVHLCTPPTVRLQPLEAALNLGFRRFIIEKPLATNEPELQAIATLRQRYGAEIVVVFNWTASRLTQHISRFMRDRPAPPTGLTIRQNKLRITRSRDSRSHTSALDVEIPHMLALATMLAGPNVRLRLARMWDLAAGETFVTDMGGARLELMFPAGGPILLDTDHASPVAERSIRLTFADGASIVGYFPYDGVELHSQLFQYDGQGNLVSHLFFEDDTLAQFLSAAYNYFDGGPSPVSDFAFNQLVCGLLNQAREHCRRSWERPAPVQRPPEAVRIVPVTYDAAGDSNQATAAAISSLEPTRPSGI